jgi:hypothetical protein
MKFTGHNGFFLPAIFCFSDLRLACLSILACIGIITGNYLEENAHFLGENSEKMLKRKIRVL